MSDNIHSVNIKSEVEASYIDYAMSVIIGRALPDVRDGLKPVHRRVLYAMYKEGMLPNKKFVKCAGVVGEVIKRYHPHGDQAVYDTLVRMAQDFSLRYPLVHGQGNFGSIDGDPAAAYRYTESKLSKIAMQLLEGIDKETVDFDLTFDETSKEPLVLPSLLPNLLLNGSSGIAVGMATNIPPHNLNEVVDAISHKIENPEATVEDLMEFIKGPDFPTSAIITGRRGIYDLYKTGRGKIIVQAKATIEEMKSGRNAIIVTEIPYMVNKTNLIENIVRLVNKGVITGISDIRDESNKKGIRMVIELKRDAIPMVILNNLYKHTQMKTTFGGIMLAIDKGRPKEFKLTEIIDAYLEHRKEVIIRRTTYLLNKSRKRAHILEGLKIALDNIDLIISIIRKSKNTEEARNALKEKFSLSSLQAQAILDMRLQQLTGLERINIENELKGKYADIENYEMILGNPREIARIMLSELKELKEKFGDERRTIITDSEDEVTPEDLIPKEDIAIALSHSGYIKRLNEDVFRSQRRGGKGAMGMKTKEDDFVEQLYTGNTHSYLLIFTNKGKCYWLKGYDIPEGTKQSKGRAIVNLLPVLPDEKVRSIVVVDEFDDEHHLFMATRKGTIKKSNLQLFSNPRSSGIIAMNLSDDDDLIFAGLTSGNDKVLLATEHGKSITFREKDARPMGRNTQGVIGIRLANKDNVVSAEILAESATIFTITQFGIGKRTSADEYRVQTRAGKGIINIKVTPKSGNVVDVKQVTDEDEIMIISKNGIMIRVKMSEFRTIGRNTQGVKVMSLKNDDEIVSIEKVFFNEDTEE
ncbi:DNA gyrase subunit A [bacterium]|nr:DNA gyrase subunit A [bacterium]